ncbi:hypothetical protein PVAG01_07887 [Phlyctema vagabunda]|uniref:Myb-like domain-containing protein n=1 Tax=Phlyctema vagabunda TaxID=108571 RepID=A0ABR4PDS6_9HELO
MSSRGNNLKVDPASQTSAQFQTRAGQADTSGKVTAASPARNKRQAPATTIPVATMSAPSAVGTSTGLAEEAIMNSSTSAPPAKKSRTNTPWTPAEEQRLKTMRDAGNSWAVKISDRPFPAELKAASKNTGIRTCIMQNSQKTRARPF